MFLDGVPATPDDLRTLGLINYGHFTSMLVRDGTVRGLDWHLDRLESDARILFDAVLDRGNVRDLIRQGVGADHGSVVARITVFDPTMELGHPGGDASPRILITTRPAGNGALLAAATLQSVVYERDVPAVKSIGLFATIFHRRRAQRAGFDDVLFTDALGRISEGATWNIGLIKDDQIVWPDQPRLAGITQRIIDQLHPGVTAELNVADLDGYDAAFMTNAGFGVRAIRSIDSNSWTDDHPLIDQLAVRYRDLPGDPV